MEAEELFLAFLPPSQRAGLRKSWYRGGLLTDLKLRYVFPLVNNSAPTGVLYRDEAKAKTELIERVLNEHLPVQVRGLPDALNWKTLLARRPGPHPSSPRQPSLASRSCGDEIDLYVAPRHQRATT